MGFYEEDDEDYWDDDYYLRTQEEEEREKWEEEEDEWEEEEDEWEDEEDDEWEGEEDDENEEDEESNGRKFNPDITNICKTKVNIEKPIVNHIDKGLPVKLTKSVPKPTVSSKSVSKPKVASKSVPKSSINTSFSSALGDAFLVVVIIILGWVVWNVLTLIANIPWYALTRPASAS